MTAYSLIMFSTAVIFLIVGIAVYRGKTELIHSYHQERVKDKRAYGRAFAKALSVISLALVASGIVALLGASGVVVILAVAVLIAGLGIGIGCIIAVQIKYNQGDF